MRLVAMMTLVVVHLSSLLLCVGLCDGVAVQVYGASGKQLHVRDPFNGDKRRLPVPPGFDGWETPISGAVFRAAGDIQHFQVVLVGTERNNQHHTRVIARVYSSETGIWGNLMSTPLPPKASSSMDQHPTKIRMWFTISVLVGHSLYWLLTNISAATNMLDGILEFDLERQTLAVIPVPVDIANNCLSQFQVMQAEGGGLGIFFLSKFSAQLWKMETDSDGVASWVLGRTVELDKPLSLNPEEEESLIIGGFAEYNNVVFLRTPTNFFMVQLESLQFKKVSKSNSLTRYDPFESVYVADALADGLGMSQLRFRTFVPANCEKSRNTLPFLRFQIAGGGGRESLQRVLTWMGDKLLNNLKDSERLGQGDEVGIFGQSIHHYQDNCFPLRIW
uniref:F-box protein AT5G49610-like beta-propeller domain-containing protein n=1 Tax=Aegilops tauschii TaxID=37682 RepID=N1QV76_AEGTA